MSVEPVKWLSNLTKLAPARRVVATGRDEAKGLGMTMPAGAATQQTPLQLPALCEIVLLAAAQGGYWLRRRFDNGSLSFA
jgi:hypothetical protein